MDYENIYKKVFEQPSYNSDTSKSYKIAIEFLQKNKNVKTICDIGSGKGNLIKNILNEDNTYELYCYDLKCFLNLNLLDSVKFSELNLTKKQDLSKIKKCDLLFCLDVLEHIEEKYVDNILYYFSKKSKKAFITIANHSDIINGQELHLIQKNNLFWDEILLKYFNIMNYREEYDKRLMIYSLETK